MLDTLSDSVLVDETSADHWSVIINSDDESKAKRNAPIWGESGNVGPDRS